MTWVKWNMLELHNLGTGASKDSSSAMLQMSHRQRLRAALDHREPDRIPVDFGTGGNTSPVPEVYAELCRLYGIECELNLVPHMMRLAKVDERILTDLDIDTRPIYMNPAPFTIRPCSEPGFFYDEWGVKWMEYLSNGVVYREVVENPLEHAMIADLESYPWWPDPTDPVRYQGLREKAEWMYSNTDFALIGCPAFNSVWERAYILCGFTRMLSALIEDVEFVHAVFRKITNIICASLEIFLNRAGPYIDVVKIGDDLGGQDNCLMSPITYRKTIMPYHQEIFRLIKQRSRAKVFLHTCGAITKLLPDLIDAGVEILNPVQVSARGMDTQFLKAEYGDRLVFWGAVDTQHVLPHGSVEDVQEEVKRRILHLGPGGGYVVAPVHNVQGDVPARNVIAMYRAALQYGVYPLGNF
jgi:uroporphyrinogen decarboxylase